MVAACDWWPHFTFQCSTQTYTTFYSHAGCESPSTAMLVVNLVLAMVEEQPFTSATLLVCILVQLSVCLQVCIPARWGLLRLHL